MNCSAARRAMHLMLDEELAPPSARRLASHLADCAACSTHWQELQRVANELAALRDSADASPRPDAARSRAPSERAARRSPLLRLAAPVAAAACLLLTLSAPPWQPVASREGESAPRPAPLSGQALVWLTGESAETLLAAPRSSARPGVHVVFLYETVRPRKPASSRPADAGELAGVALAGRLDLEADWRRTPAAN